MGKTTFGMRAGVLWPSGAVPCETGGPWAVSWTVSWAGTVNWSRAVS